MADAVTFVVTTYWKLAKGETGATQMKSRRLDVGQALNWLLNEMPDDAIRIVMLDSQGNELPEETLTSEYVRLDIDWTKVPESIRSPQIPARR